jgi:hypothetical protein
MKRHRSRKFTSFLAALVAVAALLILGRPVGPWLVLGTVILCSIVLIPAIALAFLLRAIGRSPEQNVLLLEETTVLPRRHRPAVGWLRSDLR